MKAVSLLLIAALVLLPLSGFVSGQGDTLPPNSQLNTEQITLLAGCSMLGCLFGLFYPQIIKLWKTRGGMGLLSQPHLMIYGTNQFANLVLTIGLAIVLAGLITGLQIMQLYQNPDIIAVINIQPIFAYFSAFSFGFNAASLVEEPMRRN